jgi:hypothetical protein
MAHEWVRKERASGMFIQRLRQKTRKGTQEHWRKADTTKKVASWTGYLTGTAKSLANKRLIKGTLVRQWNPMRGRGVPPKDSVDEAQHMQAGP